jgi:4-amino-4-deoxy-L-arabinose transferase-like glycosyltransferase
MRHLFCLSIACLLVLFLRLDSTRFWDQDEGFFAGAAAEMHAHDEWIVPVFNDEMFGHKPPWMYWMMMCGFKLFGVTELGARFFSAVFATASVLLIYYLGTRLRNPRAGFFAGLALGTCLMFSAVGRAATPDSYLVFFSTLSLSIFALHGFGRRTLRQTASELPQMAQQDLIPERWASFALMYAVMGLGVLTKGPIGFLFPMAVIGMFLLCATPRQQLAASATRWQRFHEMLRPFGPVNFARTVWRMRPLTAAGIILLVAGPWYLAVGLRTDGAFLYEFFGVHHFHRFRSAMDGHSGPLYYYVVAVLIGMFPWSIFAVPASLFWIRHLRERKGDFHCLLFITCWAGVYLAIFSLASTKLPNYVLPAYSALALMIGFFVDGWIRAPQHVRIGWMRTALTVLIAVGLIVVAVLPVAGLCTFNNLTLLDRLGLAGDVQREVLGLGLTGLPAFMLGIAAFLFAETNRPAAAARCVCLAAIGTMVGVWSYAAPLVDRFQTPQDIAQRIQQEEGPHQLHKVAQFRLFRPSMVFYAQRPIEHCKTIDDAADFLTSESRAYLITKGQHADQLLTQYPYAIEVLDRRSRFPEKGEIVLLRRCEQIAAMPTETKMR